MKIPITPFRFKEVEILDGWIMVLLAPYCKGCSLFDPDIRHVSDTTPDGKRTESGFTLTCKRDIFCGKLVGRAMRIAIENQKEEEDES